MSTPDKIEAILGYTFQNKALLDMAFTHSSYRNEARDQEVSHNERLEFLGDQVLGLFVSEFLYRQYPNSEEGTLSHLRAHLVEAGACAQYVTSLGLAEFLKMGKGESRNQGRGRETLLADLFEAIVGALYMDGGFDAAYLFFEDKVVPILQEHLKNPPQNYKAQLQMICQRLYKTHPVYTVLEEVGPEHSKHFKVAVMILTEQLGVGEGASKKQAEMQAAKEAWQRLQEKDTR